MKYSNGSAFEKLSSQFIPSLVSLSFRIFKKKFSSLFILANLLVSLVRVSRRVNQKQIRFIAESFRIEKWLGKFETK